MNTRTRKIPALIACALCSCGLWASAASAQDKYPSRPIRLVIPFAPGGGSDVTARMLGPRIAEQLGQPVVIDNRPAASGVVGADIVAKAVPDGYTLLGTTVTFVINGTLQKGLPYDAFKDFAPITQGIVSPFGLLLHPAVPAKTVKEFIAYARSNPGKLLYGSSGPGSSPHLSAELFLSMAGLQMTFSNVFSTLGHWKAGRLRLLAHGGLKRAESFPDIPTIAEAGLPGYESSNWYGYVTTARTPRPIIRALNQAFVSVLNQPDVRKTLVAQGNDVIGNTPEEFAKVIQADARRWGDIGRKLGVTLN